MNKVISRVMAVAELPEALARDFDPTKVVRVTVEELSAADASAVRERLRADLAAMLHDVGEASASFQQRLAARPPLGPRGVSVADAVHRIRELRDNADD
jgi:hypothetical protein